MQFFSAKEEPELKLIERIKLMFSAHWRGIICIFVPLLLTILLLPFPPEKWQWCAYVLILMAIFWVSECIPLAVTGFFPVLLFPMTGVMSTSATCKCYINDSIMMFLGSLMLAYSVEQSGLHKRLAYFAIRMIGYSHYKLLLAMCCVTTFVSMWITNTAAVTMMVPINFAVLKVFENQGIIKIYETGSDGEKQASDITTCYFCAATFSATIGGIGTLVGTATNLVFKGLFISAYPLAPEYLSFPRFSAFAVPYMIILEALLYLYLCIVYFGLFRKNSAAAKKAIISKEGKLAAKKAIEKDCKEMGKITFWEVMVIILFGGAMIAFFCRSPQIFQGWGDIISEYFKLEDMKFVRDSALAMCVSFLMFLFPSTLALFKNCKAKFHEELPKGPVPSVLNWRMMNANMPYSFMFLLGGGFALSEAAKTSGLNAKLGEYLQSLKDLPNALVLLLIIIVTCFVTNFASNVAVCNVFAPIAMQLAREINQNPLWYNIAAGFTASYCFMIPVGTPGNLIVQSAAKVPTKKMDTMAAQPVAATNKMYTLVAQPNGHQIKAGAGPTLSTIIITWLAIYLWAPIIWPDLLTMPSWIEG